MNHVLDGIEISTRSGNFGDCLAHSKALAVSAAVFAAKRIIQSAIMTRSCDAVFHQNTLTTCFNMKIAYI